MRSTAATAALCLALAACGPAGTESNLDDANPPTTTSSVAPEPQPEPTQVSETEAPSDLNRLQIGLVDLGYVDPGVATSLTVWDRDEWREAAATVTGAADIDLSRCHLRAPGEWVIEGTVTVPGTGPAKTVLGFGAGLRIDVFDSGIPVTVTFAQSGEFALLVNGFELHRSRSGTERLVLEPFFEGPTCNIAVEFESLLVAEVPRTLAADPLVWEAPADTLQSLGVGVVLSDPSDHRMQFAYLAWGRQAFFMPTVWVPDLPDMRLVEVIVQENSVCSLVRFDSSGTVRVSDPEHGIFVSHFRSCDFTDLLMPGRGAATSVPGFTFDETLATRGIVADLEGTLVSVESLSATIEELEAVAEKLVPYRNLHTAPPADSSGVSKDLDAAIESALGSIGATERGRFSLGDLLVVVATYVDTDTTPSTGDVLASSYIVRENNGVYGVESVSRTGGSDLCLAFDFVNTQSSGSWFVRIGAEPDWIVQKMVDGVWADLPTVGGVYFVGATDSIVDPGPGPFRAVDGDRRPVRCSTFSPLEPGEQWSDWQPPTARNDLPLTVTPSSGLRDGDVVDLVASGFPAEGTIHAQMCRLETVEWMDSLDCDAGGATVNLIQDQSGNLAAAFTVAAEFTTQLGDVVDCRTELCAIRLDSTSGFRRSAVAEVEFAP